MEGEEVVCEICGKAFEAPEEFRKHSAEMHDVYVPASGGQGKRAAPDTDDNVEG